MFTGFWCGQPEGKRPLERTKRSWENDIKVIYSRSHLELGGRGSS